jgi:cell wall-associated NlpC family hydrolase
VTYVSKARRGALIGTAIVLAGGLAAGISQVAGAEPKPSISQVQAEVNALTAKFDKAVQQYDQIAQQLNAARARLGQVNKEMGTDQAKYADSRRKVVQIANAAYEDSGSTSLAGLLTSNNPAQVLTEASMVEQFTGARNLEAQAFLAAAQQLTSVQQEQQRTEYGISQLARQRAQTKNYFQKLLNTEKATLDTLTAQQQAAVQNNNVGGGGTGSGGTGSGSKVPYTGPTGSQADEAVKFAYDQLGCPYVWGATGPCSAGFDCSGLVQAAWASAGVSIPRDTYEQWAALPHIPLSQVQPGDLLYYDGIGHVAMYVGGGYIIDAPTPGQNVERVPENESWYVDNFDGAARP